MDRQQILNKNDVISVDINNNEEETENSLMGHHTFKVDEFLAELLNETSYKLGEKWFIDGVKCKILSPNKSWRKGKIKISLEFISDEPESPLDEIRNHPSFPKS